MMHEEPKHCLYPVCNKVLSDGRSDKKYCGNQCRSAHYQLIHHKTIVAERQLTKGNRINERVLRQLLVRLPKCTEFPECIDISLETLKGAGYNLKFTGKAFMMRVSSKAVNAYQYNDVYLISHPVLANRYLIKTT
jgi:hypothetical protein